MKNLRLHLILILMLATTNVFAKTIKFRLDGVETTQGIQYYKSKLKTDNPDPKARPQPDNSIPMIAYRNTGLRFYFDTTIPKTRLQHKITGTLEVTVPGAMPTKITISPSNPATPKRATAIDRGDKFQTLNFLIPAVYSHDTIQIKLNARLESMSTRPIRPVARLAHTMTITFEKVPELEVAELLVRQVAQDGSTAAQESAGGYVKQAFAEDVFKLYPISSARISSLPFYTDTPPTNPTSFIFKEGNKPPKPSDKKAPIYATISEGMGDYAPVFFAIMPWSCNSYCDPIAQGSPTYRGVAAYNNVLNSRNVAHELGHAICGFRDLQGSNDLEYPQYQMDGMSLSRQSIGEYGYDPVANKVYRPNSTDFMVAPPRIPSGDGFWISPFHYTELLQCLKTRSWTKSCTQETNSVDFNNRCWG